MGFKSPWAERVTPPAKSPYRLPELIHAAAERGTNAYWEAVRVKEAARDQWVNGGCQGEFNGEYGHTAVDFITKEVTAVIEIYFKEKGLQI